jgi:hypothetical protein
MGSVRKIFYIISIFIGVTLQKLVGRKTWTKKNIGIILVVAVGYGIWFNYLDAAVYCTERYPGYHPSPKFCQEISYKDQEGNEKKLGTVPIGKILGDNQYYQPWNIIGHVLPGLLLLLLMPKRVELFLAAVLISSAVMDSPLWGVMRLAIDLPLWHIEDGRNFVETWDLGAWVVYYYNPFGAYPVWGDSWLGKGLPNAAMIFWSVALRLIFAGILIVWQIKQEEQGKEFSLKKIILLSNYRANRRKNAETH